jgi:hypothetical protein
MTADFCRRGRHRFQASFRWASICTFWRLGFKQSSLHRYHAGPPKHHPIRLDMALGFLACYFPLVTFRSRVSHQTQEFLLSFLPAARAIQHCASWRRRCMEKKPRSARLRMPGVKLSSS